MTPILRLASGGDGVTADGRFVPFSAPGDALDAAGMLQPGPHHQTPPCRHFPVCGGCQLQHVDDDTYAAFVHDRVVAALVPQGLGGVEVVPTHLSPPGTRRRAALRAERIGARTLLGFHAEKSHRIVDMRECHILHPALFALVEPLRGLLGRMLRAKRAASVSLTLVDQGVEVALTGVSVEGLAATEALTAFATEHRLARLSVDEGQGPETRWEPDPATVSLGGVAVPFPPGAFLQATADGEAALVSAVRGAVGGARMVADLFAGLGTFALPLSHGARVLAVEGETRALLALKAAAARAVRPVFAEARDLFRRPLTVAELDRFDAVVLDPPRTGAKEQVEALAAAQVTRLAYVSCNPSTFARDARVLVDGGWRLDRVHPVGQFRWSTHVELAAAFSRPA